MNKWIVALSLFLSLGAQAEEPASFTVRAPKSVYLFPVSRASCHQLVEGKTGTLQVEPNSFEVGSLALNWKGQNLMQVGSVTLSFKSEVLEGGSYQCQIAGKELESVFSLYGHVLEPNDTTYSGMCGIRCGGVKFIPEVRSATITGKLTVTGHELTEEGRFTAISTETPISLEYTKW